MKKNWKIWVGMILSLLFLFFAFRNIDWPALGRSMLTANYWEIFFSSCLVAAMLLIRGYRWQFFLKPIQKLPVIPLFWSTCIGFGVNNVLPARLGEVARSYSLSKKSKLTFMQAVGSIVVERLYDTFAILFLFVFSLFVLDFPDLTKLFGRDQNEIAILLSIMALILLSGVMLLKLQTERMLKIAKFFLTPLPSRFTEKIISATRHFVSGLTQTKNPLECIWIIVMALGMWVISAITVWLVVDACHVTLNASQTMVVLMSMVVAVSIPAAPGYAGTYHYLASMALMLVVDIPKEQALTIATLIHAANYIPQTALGLGALAFEGIKMSEVKEAAQALEKDQPA